MSENYAAEQTELNNTIIDLEDLIETHEEMDDNLDQFLAFAKKNNTARHTLFGPYIKPYGKFEKLPTGLEPVIY